MGESFNFENEQPTLHPVKSLFGENPNAANARDRLMLSNCYRTQNGLLTFRKGLFLATFLLIGVGVASVFVNVFDSENDRVNKFEFFFEASLYGWLSFLLHLLFTILSSKRIINFEAEVPDSVLQVQIFQSEDNIYTQPLTKSEKLSMHLFSVSFVLVLGSTSYSGWRVLFENDHLSLLVVNLSCFLLLLLSFLIGRQRVEFCHLADVIVVMGVFLGSNYLASEFLFERNIYEELDWKDISIPETIFELLQASAFFLVSFFIGKVLSFVKDNTLEAKY